MARKIIGWILFVWGLGGLIANIVFVIVWSSFPEPLVINTIVCLVFIWGGWRLAHPKAIVAED